MPTRQFRQLPGHSRRINGNWIAAIVVAGRLRLGLVHRVRRFTTSGQRVWTGTASCLARTGPVPYCFAVEPARGRKVDLAQAIVSPFIEKANG
jgi:hypothetical protein